MQTHDHAFHKQWGGKPGPNNKRGCTRFSWPKVMFKRSGTETHQSRWHEPPKAMLRTSYVRGTEFPSGTKGRHTPCLVWWRSGGVRDAVCCLTPTWTMNTNQCVQEARAPTMWTPASEASGVALTWAENSAHELRSAIKLSDAWRQQAARPFTTRV